MCNVYRYVLVFVSSLLVSIDASGLGDCPKYRSMQNFNITAFTGHWFEVERSFYIMEIAASCTTVDITTNKRGQLEVTAKAINRWTGNKTTPTRGLAIPTKRDPTVLKYQVSTNLPPSLARMLPAAGTYQVLRTDYYNYAILWTCSSMGIAHIDLIWVLGRSRYITAVKRAEIYDTLTNLDIDSDRLIISRNRNCPEGF